MKHTATAMLMGTLTGLTGCFALASVYEHHIWFALPFGAITGLFLVMTVYDLACGIQDRGQGDRK